MNNNNLDFDIQELKVGTFNVRGIKNSLKQDAILQNLKRLKLNIVALQETHLLENEIGPLENKWNGPILFTVGTNNSKGLCILFDEYFKKANLEIIYKTDRILLCSCNISSNTFYFCNIYAPNEVNLKIQFFKDLKNHLTNLIKDISLQNLLLLGDFNCVLNNNLDIVAGNFHSQEAVKTFNSVIDETELCDIWRLKNKNKKDYTWSRNNPLTARRLDYILSSKFLLPLIVDCHIISIGHSDHRLVMCKMEFHKFIRGKGTYKMNTSLFENKTFQKSIRNLIKTNEKELEELEPVLKWEVIKLQVKEQTQNFGKYNTFRNKEETRDLRARLNNLENELANNVDDLTLQKEVEKIKTELELKNIEQAKAAKIRAKVQWIEEGEKCSSYFLALEKHNSLNNTVYKIKDKWGNNKTEGSEIVAVFAEHFSHVYTDNVNSQNSGETFDDFVKNINLKQVTEQKKNILTVI